MLKRDDTEGLRLWRERQAWRSSQAGIASQIAQYAIRLAVVPLSLHLLGAERYGLWLTVGSLVAWMGLANLGIAPGLLNAIANASGSEDRALMRSHLSTALLAYTLIALPAAVFIAFVARWRGVGRLLHIVPGTPLATDAGTLVLICGGAFVASFLTNVVGTTCGALQEGYLSAWPSVVGAGTGLALLLILPLHGGSVVDYALVMAIPPLLATLALGVYVFGWRHPDLRPSFSLASGRSLGVLAGYGGPLLLVQAADLVMLYSANLLIANRLGPAAVPQFAVPNAVFGIFTTACYTLIGPYAAAFAEASGRGDWAWLRNRAFTNLRNAVGLMALACLGLVAFGRTAIRIYTHSIVVPTPSFLVAMAAYCLLIVWATTNGLLLIGLGRVRGKAALEICVAIVYVAGAWLLLPTFGIIAVPLAGVLAYLVDLAWSLPYALSYIRQQAATADARVAAVESCS